MRQVVVYRGEDEYWIAECPNLPGCLSQGKTKEQAVANIKEAIKGYVATLEEDNLPVPEESQHALDILWLLAHGEKEIEAGVGYELDEVLGEADRFLEASKP